MTQLKDYLGAVELFSAIQEEPTWLLERRKAALAQVDELRLPHIDQVRYRDWPLFDVTADSMEHSELPDSIGVMAFDAMEDHPLLVQAGGITVAEQLPQHLIDAGVIFTDLFTAAKEHSELVEAYFMKQAVTFDEDKLTAAHLAFLNSGAFLYIPKNLVIDEPVEAVFQQMGDSHFFHHVLIVAEENSQFNYLERFVSAEGQSVNRPGNIVVEVITRRRPHQVFRRDRLGKNLTTYLNRRGVYFARCDDRLGHWRDERRRYRSGLRYGFGRHRRAFRV